MEIKEEYLRAFFQKNADYYIEKWNKFNTGHKVGFKPYALLFGISWIFYRKMYREGLIIFLILMIEGMIETFILSASEIRSLDNQRMRNAIGTIILVSFIGFTGNSIYMRSAKRKISRILTKPDLSEELIIKELRKAGGTSFVFLFIIVGILTIFLLLNNSLK